MPSIAGVIHAMNKDELIGALAKKGIDTSGNIDDLQRLKRYTEKHPGFEDSRSDEEKAFKRSERDAPPKEA